MKFGLNSTIINEIKNEIFDHLGSTKNPKIFIYGSRAKGNFRTYSDIDLLLYADEYDFNELEKIDFDKLDIPYKVDFVLEKNLYPAYKDEIKSHMVPFI
jgi:predicted nucleotidyltransferase